MFCFLSDGYFIEPRGSRLARCSNAAPSSYDGEGVAFVRYHTRCNADLNNRPPERCLPTCPNRRTATASSMPGNALAVARDASGLLRHVIPHWHGEGSAPLPHFASIHDNLAGPSAGTRSLGNVSAATPASVMRRAQSEHSSVSRSHPARSTRIHYHCSLS